MYKKRPVIKRFCKINKCHNERLVAVNFTFTGRNLQVSKISKIQLKRLLVEQCCLMLVCVFSWYFLRSSPNFTRKLCVRTPDPDLSRWRSASWTRCKAYIYMLKTWISLNSWSVCHITKWLLHFQTVVAGFSKF